MSCYSVADLISLSVSSTLQLLNCWYNVDRSDFCCLPVCVSIEITEPGKPGRPVVNLDDKRQVTIECTPPDSDGGYQITQYIIYSGSPDVDSESFVKQEIAGRATSCIFSKRLALNCMYKFAVAAESKSGIGPLSEFSEWVKTPNRGGK